MTSSCTICGAPRRPRNLAPYYPAGSDERRHACEDDRCRELAREEIRRGVIVDSHRRAA